MHTQSVIHGCIYKILTEYYVYDFQCKVALLERPIDAVGISYVEMLLDQYDDVVIYLGYCNGIEHTT